MTPILIRSSLLFGLWLLLSGEAKGLLLGLGLASALLAAGITTRMDAVDGEGRSFIPGIGILAFWAWLTGQVVRANLDVAQRVLSPRLPISPRVFRVRTSQATDLGRVTFANAITLTPGTVSIDLRRNEIEVHALSQEAAEGLASGVMDRMVTTLLEGRSR